MISDINGKLILFLMFLFASGNIAICQNSSEVEDVGVVINISERKLFVYKDGEEIKDYPVAVGKEDNPTPTGNFQIHRIDWNPDWAPPDSEWSEDEEYKNPGDADNPMGRVRIVYQAPYSIHGTEDLDSLGEDESHGSVRMANDDVIELAKFLMGAAGVEKSDDWYEEILDDPEVMIQVFLPRQIPITNESE